MAPEISISAELVAQSLIHGLKYSLIAKAVLRISIRR